MAFGLRKMAIGEVKIALTLNYNLHNLRSSNCMGYLSWFEFLVQPENIFFLLYNTSPKVYYFGLYLSMYFSN